MVVQEDSGERVETNDVEERVNGGKVEQEEDEKEEEGDASDSPEEAQLELDR